MGAPPENVEGAAFVDLGNADARSLIRRADTIFVASFARGPTGSPSMDIFHRGGKPGFLRVDDGVITIPDFSGNRFFNTLGNVLLTDQAGIVVPCFETGDVLVLTGDAELGPGRGQLHRRKQGRSGATLAHATSPMLLACAARCPSRFSSSAGPATRSPQETGLHPHDIRREQSHE
jgi:hypothetical protein